MLNGKRNGLPLDGDVEASPFDPGELSSIFRAVESTVIASGDRERRTEPMGEALKKASGEAAMVHTDAEYFLKMVHVIFYSGMKAAIVSQKVPAIDRHFADYSVVARYGEQDVLRILADPEMLRNEKKIRICIRNAKTFAAEIETHGSFAAYLRSFAGVEEKSSERLRTLWEDLRKKFLGRIISFHYLMEVGYNFVKPDRVITRIFSRLRLIKLGRPQDPDHPNAEKLTDDQLWEIVGVGQKIAESTQLPIRYIDLVFVVYGQMTGRETEGQAPGLPRGICLDAPRCYLCGIVASCSYEPKTLSAAS